MELTGSIVKVLPVETGSGRKGQWHKQDFILKQPGQYGKDVCVSVWGEDLINKYDLEDAVGLTVTAHINVESREYNGRWYTDVRAWKVTWDEQARRKWQNGGDGKKGAPASDGQEDTSLRTHYEGMGSGPQTDDLPF